MPQPDRLRNRIHERLPEPDYRRIVAQMERVTPALGEVVAQPGVPPKWVHFPLSAVLSSMVVLEDGSTVDQSRFRGPDDPYAGGWLAFPKTWPSTESEVLAREVRGVVAAALDLLPARQQVVLTLRDIDGQSADEVCSLLEISTANQRVLLHRARAAVRSHLEQYYATTGGAA